MVDSGLNWVQVSSGLSQIAQPSLILDDIGYWILDDIGWLVLQRLKFFVRFLRSVIDCATQHDIGSHLLSIPCLSRNHPNVPQIEYSYVQEKICQKKSSSFFLPPTIIQTFVQQLFFPFLGLQGPLRFPSICPPAAIISFYPFITQSPCYVPTRRSEKYNKFWF